MNAKKIITYSLFILVFALLLQVSLFACSKTPGDQTGSKDGVSDTSPQSGDISEEEKFIPHLDPAKLNLKGFELKILTSADNRTYAVEQFVGYIDDEDKSEPVSLAVYERNARLENEYGFTIQCEALETGFANFLERVRNDVGADLCDYHVMANGTTVIAPLTVEGYCYDFYTLQDSFLALDESWWDPVTQADMSIGNHLYMVTGDIMLLDDQMTFGMFFNKDLITEYHLDSPFDLVYDDDWTLDEMYYMIKEVAHSGGGGVMNALNGEDTWGMVGVAFHTYQLVMGGGKGQVVKDAEDLPRFAMGDDANVNTFLKVFDIITDRDRVAIVENYCRYDAPEAEIITDAFYEGRALFSPGTISAVTSDKMRNAEIRYGIVPMPKYDAAQDNYASTINPYHFFVMAIPNSNVEDIDKITFCLEAMAYAGRQTVTPVYYELTLKLKRFADDDDSPEMLDVIFKNRLVDISVIFNWDDCIQYYNNLFFARSSNISAYCESKINSFNAKMQETIDAYARIAELED